MKFEWDSSKSEINYRKHGIRFEEAATVFFDTDTKVARDPEHSEKEDRFLALGFSAKQRLLLVVHCYRENDEMIRIVSARRVTRSERKQFEEGL